MPTMLQELPAEGRLQRMSGGGMSTPEERNVHGCGAPPSPGR